MSAGVSHRLVGYDKVTGRVAVEYDIPQCNLPDAKLIAGVSADDPEGALCYRLNSRQTQDLAAAIGASINPDALNFYMEGFAAPSRSRSGGS
jgi:hypothetical protein